MKKTILLLILISIASYSYIIAQNNNLKYQQTTYLNHRILEAILLPEPVFESEMSVEEAIKSRRSIREYSSEGLSLEEFGQILWAAYGITKPDTEREFMRGGKRTAPSAGARYPLEIYIVVTNVNGLLPGIYLYRSQGHQLLKIAEGNFREALADATYSTDVINNAPACLVYSAIFERTTMKYGERGRERYVCMDVGFSAENVYLQALSLGIGTVMVGSVIDDKVKGVINLSDDETPMCFMPIGKIE